jgi:hypothetical protein
MCAAHHATSLSEMLIQNLFCTGIKGTVCTVSNLQAVVQAVLMITGMFLVDVFLSKRTVASSKAAFFGWAYPSPRRHIK